MITNQQNPMEAKSIDTSHESDFNMDEVIRIANERFPQKDTSKTMNNPDCAMRITPILKKLLTQQERIDAGNPYSLDEIIETYTIQLADTKNNATLKPGFHVASTFGLVYACFLQHQDFEGLLNAIRIGYDTDSQAAIIGAMIGALRGPFYDPSYIE